MFQSPIGFPSDEYFTFFSPETLMRGFEFNLRALAAPHIIPHPMKQPAVIAYAISSSAIFGIV